MLLVLLVFLAKTHHTHTSMHSMVHVLILLMLFIFLMFAMLTWLAWLTAVTIVSTIHLAIWAVSTSTPSVEVISCSETVLTYSRIAHGTWEVAIITIQVSLLPATAHASATTSISHDLVHGSIDIFDLSVVRELR